MQEVIGSTPIFSTPKEKLLQSGFFCFWGELKQIQSTLNVIKVTKIARPETIDCRPQSVILRW
jgi:hypothetical protein